MLVEVIAIFYMLITDRMEEYCQFLLHADDLQFEPISIGQAVAVLGSAFVDKMPSDKKPSEWSPLEPRLLRFSEARNVALHSVMLLKNSALTSSLEDHIHSIADAAEDGVRLVSVISAFVSKHIKFDG